MSIGARSLRWFRAATSAAPWKFRQLLDEVVGTEFILFHQRICGPLANSLFHRRPEKTTHPPARIETAYHKADAAIQKLVDLIAA